MQIETCHEEIFPNLLKTFKCRECFSEFETKSDRNADVIGNHSEIDIECEVCGKFFVSKSELNNHRAKHEDPGNDIAALNNLLQGLLTKHEEVSNVKESIELERNHKCAFKCEDCDEVFATKTNLKKHKSRFHKIFKVKQTIQKSIRKIECGLCEMDFAAIEYMDKHMDEMHQGRWKLNDPDVVWEGESYDESSSADSETQTDTDSDEENSEEEVSEAQSGGE